MVRVALRALRVTAPVCLVACIELCVLRGLHCGAWDDLLLCVLTRRVPPVQFWQCRHPGAREHQQAVRRRAQARGAPRNGHCALAIAHERAVALVCVKKSAVVRLWMYAVARSPSDSERQRQRRRQHARARRHSRSSDRAPEPRCCAHAWNFTPIMVAARVRFTFTHGLFVASM